MYDSVMTKLTPEQIDEQVKTVCSFLSAVHPSLVNEPQGFRPCVEIRPIPRGSNSTYEFKKSLNIWDLSEETKQYIRKFFERHNGQPTCIYYSVFAYDNFAKTLTKKGTPAKPGKITGEAAFHTNEIALDFDGIGFEEYTGLVDSFEDMGIYALWVFTGHGFQAHILLDKPLEDKNILKQFVYLVRAKGFNCDAACVDPARVMRLPGTYNCKCFADETYSSERSCPPHCEIIQESEARYPLDKLINSFSSLPTVNEEDEKTYLNSTQTEKPSKAMSPPKSKKSTVGSVQEDTIRIKRIEYPHIERFEFPDAVMRMLSYAPQGYRNSVLGFLIKYFKKYHRMSRTVMQDILKVWSAQACDPAYPEDEFKEDFARLYYYNGLNYDTKLSKKYGIIDFEGLVTLRKKEILLPHKFFNAFAELSGQAVRAYLAIKMLEHVEETCTIERIAELLDISVRALRPTIKELTESRFAYVKKGVPQRKIPNTYHSDHFNPSREGYVQFSYNDIKAYITELYEPGSRGNGELKLYLFMHGKFSKGDIYMSQATLGTKLGLAQNSISVIVNRLKERHFLKIEKTYRSGLESCTYFLLR